MKQGRSKVWDEREETRPTWGVEGERGVVKLKYSRKIRPPLSLQHWTCLPHRKYPLNVCRINDSLTMSYLCNDCHPLLTAPFILSIWEYFPHPWSLLGVWVGRQNGQRQAPWTECLCPLKIRMLKPQSQCGGIWRWEFGGIISLD